MATGMSDDISRILNSWHFDPDDDSNPVRVILGEDGRERIQLRLDMGLIQMYLDGNPTDDAPEGYPSWLEYFEARKRRADSGSMDDGVFVLGPDDMKKLRREGVQYYQRYLSLMKLGDYPRVIRDTERNLRLITFVKRNAVREGDRWALDQFRPYVIMINTQARVSQRIHEDPDTPPGELAAVCDEGIASIEAFYDEYNLESEMEHSIELSILTTLKHEFAREQRQTEPPEPQTESLDERLLRAVKEERFEDAADLRDEIRRQQSHEKS